ncbi:hypothetical protein VP01_3099g1 [Puccinia sorghi]|uniref:Uncharacterized protein n=1 Tax=Puccinia sorghi TaxID=27349 RepID=A0A0L6UZM5_9BASI|nr:hypothetical protein VP01_3099g1 [Puccinia sorghi]
MFFNMIYFCIFCTLIINIISCAWYHWNQLLELYLLIMFIFSISKRNPNPFCSFCSSFHPSHLVSASTKSPPSPSQTAALPAVERKTVGGQLRVLLHCFQTLPFTTHFCCNLERDSEYFAMNDIYNKSHAPPMFPHPYSSLLPAFPRTSTPRHHHICLQPQALCFPNPELLSATPPDSENLSSAVLSGKTLLQCPKPPMTASPSFPSPPILAPPLTKVEHMPCHQPQLLLRPTAAALPIKTPHQDLHPQDPIKEKNNIIPHRITWTGYQVLKAEYQMGKRVSQCIYMFLPKLSFISDKSKMRRHRCAAGKERDFIFLPFFFLKKRRGEGERPDRSHLHKVTCQLGREEDEEARVARSMRRSTSTSLFKMIERSASTFFLRACRLKKKTTRPIRT